MENITMLKCIRSLFCAKPSVAIIKLHGVIGASTYTKSSISMDSLAERITEAFSIKNLQAVILQINSPGGSPAQSELIYKRIRSLADKKNIKVLAFTEDCAASGGYWLACAADKIYSAENSIIGSIGVISSSFGFDKTIKKLGIDRRIYTQGSSKSILDPFSPEKQDDIKIIKEVQQDIYENFKKLVLSRRKNISKKDEDVIFSGAFWSSKKAMEMGLIDGISDIYTTIHDEYGDKIKIKKINFEKSWIKSKLGISVELLMESLLDKVEEKIIKAKFGSLS